MQFALGAVFLLVLLRVALRRTWLAVLALLFINVPLAAWSWTPTALVFAISTAALFSVVVLRLGLLAGVAALATERLLTSLPSPSTSMRGISRIQRWCFCSFSASLWWRSA